MLASAVEGGLNAGCVRWEGVVSKGRWRVVAIDGRDAVSDQATLRAALRWVWVQQGRGWREREDGNRR